MQNEDPEGAWALYEEGLDSYVGKLKSRKGRPRQPQGQPQSGQPEGYEVSRPGHPQFGIQPSIRCVPEKERLQGIDDAFRKGAISDDESMYQHLEELLK